VVCILGLCAIHLLFRSRSGRCEFDSCHGLFDATTAGSPSRAMALPCPQQLTKHWWHDCTCVFERNIGYRCRKQMDTSQNIPATRPPHGDADDVRYNFTGWPLPPCSSGWNSAYLGCIWDVATGEFLQELDGHTNYVWSVAFSPDSRHIASGSGDYMVCLWDAAMMGALLRQLDGHTGWVRIVAFSAEGCHLASG